MSLAFKCKRCGKKYRNVSAELSGRKIRCDCGRIQRLLTRDEQQRRAREKLQKKQEQLETELANDADWPVNEKETVSILPTLPPGYLKNAFKPSMEELPSPRFLASIGIASGIGAVVLGVALSACSTRMILAGTTGTSFIDPVTQLDLTLCSAAGVRITAFAIFFLAAGMLIGGVSQLASCVVEVESATPKPVWPDCLVALAGICFVFLVCLDIAIVNQVKSNKIQFRRASLVHSMEAAADRGRALDSEFGSEQESGINEAEAAANRGVKLLILRSLPLCAVAILFSIASVCRYRIMRRRVSRT